MEKLPGAHTAAVTGYVYSNSLQIATKIVIRVVPKAVR